MRQGVKKKRSSEVHKKKCDKITGWYRRLKSIREEPVKVNPNTKHPAIRRELKSLEEYISKIKKPTN